MNSALALHRFHFAFTVTYHYLFPQLTMGLALLILVLKTRALTMGSEVHHRAARFWARIFALNFAMGVVTGIPLEFQFGTNWARFSKAAGGAVGQTLAMESVFAFFLESAFLGLFLHGEKKLSPRGHWFVALLLALGTWISAYFIVATNAWMQHPVGHGFEEGVFRIESLGAILTNPWLFWQFAHTMAGSVTTAGVVMAAAGAFYLIVRRHEDCGRVFVTNGVVAALLSSLLLSGTGDFQAKNIARHQPVTLAGMEGLFRTEKGAPIVLIGQPDMDRLRLDNPIEVPRLLSFLTHYRWGAEVKGLDAFPRDSWPDQIPLLYYCYHVMVGLGTLLIAVLAVAAVQLRRRKIFDSRGILWTLLLLVPFPYIANTAGWLTAELGRQPWVVYGLLRTRASFSENVSAGNALFSLIGFMGVYALLSILFFFLLTREFARGPVPAKH